MISFCASRPRIEHRFNYRYMVDIEGDNIAPKVYQPDGKKENDDQIDTNNTHLKHSTNST
jgi:hypothetical protein